MLAGSLTQFQALYACGLMNDGKPVMVICCDEPGEMAMMADSCQNPGEMIDGGMNAGGMSGDKCCDLSCQSSQVAGASLPCSSEQQAVMLNAPQPPPLPVSFNLPDIVLANDAVNFAVGSISPRSDGPLYLLTNRFRI